MKLLRQSTAVNVQLGPALDKTDGVTEEVALSPTVYLSKNGAAQGARNSATAITHDALGYYIVELNATDTNTLGILRALFHDNATHLPVWDDFMVLTANAYDSLFSADKLQVDVQEWKGAAAPAMTGDAFARLGAPAGVSVSADIATANSGIVTVDGKAVVIDGNVNAILADTGTDGVVVNALGLATDAVTEIVNAIKAAVVETEGSYTIQQVLSIVLAVCAGVSTASGNTFKSPNGLGTRVVGTVNASAERTAVTLTPSA